jgi:hypothetical protein
MKLILTLYILGAIFVHAAFSEFHILRASSDLEEHRKYIPILSEDPSSPNVVIVRIPFYEDFREYWLVTCTHKLPDEQLEFRNFLWEVTEIPTPDYITSIIPLGQKFDYWERPAKALGYTTFKVHKNLLGKTYLYYDYSSSVSDGGYYYCIDLSSFPIKKTHK